MSLHFLLKAGARTLSVVQVLAMSDDNAFSLFRHLRWGEGEELLVGRDESALQGEIQVDGAYVGGTVRPANKKEDRVDRRLAENQDPDKRCILVMREAYTEAEVEAGNAGARKTLTFILKNENQQGLP